MEAIIRTDDKSMFDALLKFLKTLNVKIETKDKPIEKAVAVKDTKKSKKLLTEFQKLLLNGPVMSDNDFKYFQEKRNELNKWK